MSRRGALDTTQQSVADSPATRGRRTRKRASDRKAELLKIGTEQLIQSGHAAVTMRSVAQAAGLSVAAVQHHFPTRSEMLKEIVETVVAQYTSVFASLAEEHGSDPEEWLRALLRTMFEANRTETVASLFYEIWALASRDPHARLAMRMLYEANYMVYRNVIQAFDPDGRSSTIDERAAILAAAVDGLMVGMDYVAIDENAVSEELVRIARDGRS